MGLCEKIGVIEYRPGHVIMHEGDEGDCLYVIISGKIGVYIKGVKVGSSGPKDVVGDFALESEHKRTATLIGDTTVKALILSRTDYEDILLSRKKIEKQENTKFLLKTEFFHTWDFVKLQRLVMNTIAKTYSKGETIYNINDEPSSFYIIKEGGIKIKARADIKQQNR